MVYWYNNQQVLTNHRAHIIFSYCINSNSSLKKNSSYTVGTCWQGVSVTVAHMCLQRLDSVQGCLMHSVSPDVCLKQGDV